MPKLSPDELSKIRQAHWSARKTEAEAKVANASLDLLVSNYFAKHDFVQGKHAICLHCGAFLLVNNPCPCVERGNG